MLCLFLYRSEVNTAPERISAQGKRDPFFPVTLNKIQTDIFCYLAN